MVLKGLILQIIEVNCLKKLKGEGSEHNVKKKKAEHTLAKPLQCQGRKESTIGREKPFSDLKTKKPVEE